MYDPQIGRFGQLDPADGFSQNVSLYSFTANNPIFYNDPLGLWKDSIKLKNGEEAYANQPYNDPIVVKGEQKATPFYWPSDINAQNNKQWDHDRYLAFRRIEFNQPLVQGGESLNYLGKLDWYKNYYKNEMDYRQMQITAVLIEFSPLLIEEISAGLSSADLAKVVQSIEQKVESFAVDQTISINDLRQKTAELIVRVLSKYKLAPYSMLKDILNAGREYKSAAELFEKALKIYEGIKTVKEHFGL